MTQIASITDILSRVNDTSDALGNAKMTDLVETMFLSKRRIARQTVSLTAAADTTVFTVPAGYRLHVTDVILEGVVAQSGGTASTLKLGTVSGSYGELLNSTTGHAFTSATATTLLPASRRAHVWDIYEMTNMNDARNTIFAPGSVIVANVSGTVVTAGSIAVELWGVLIPV